MKHIIFIALLFCTFSARAQYPTHPTKQELGRQTTGDGLTFRGSGAPAYTPTGKNNAWMFLDTLSGTLYAHMGGSWQVVSAGGGSEITDVSVSNDTLYITTTDSTFVAVFDDANTNFANSNLTFTGNRVHNLSTRTLTIADGGTYPTFQQSAATDGITLASSATDIIAQTPGLLQIENSDTITITSDRIRMNAADTRIQQVSKNNGLNRVMMIDSITERVYYRDVSSISAGGGGSGTVTSVAAGTGLTGGTITTSGTISADTSKLSTVYSVRDSLLRAKDQANLYAQFDPQNAEIMQYKYVNNGITALSYRDDTSAYIYTVNDTGDDFYRWDILGTVATKYISNSDTETGSFVSSGLTRYGLVGATMLKKFTGTKIQFVHYTDDRGGIWTMYLQDKNRVTIDSAEVDTYAAVAAYKFSTVFENLDYDTYYIYAVKNANYNPSSTGDDRGWAVNYVSGNATDPSTTHTWKISTSVKDSINFIYDGLFNMKADPSLAEFAFTVKRLAGATAYDWIPFHGNQATFFQGDSLTVLADESEITSTTVTELENKYLFTPVRKISVFQDLYGVNSYEPAKKLVDIKYTHYLTPGEIDFFGDFKWTDTVAVFGYGAMMPFANAYADTVTTAQGQKLAANATDNSNEEITQENGPIKSFQIKSTSITDKVAYQIKDDATQFFRRRPQYLQHRSDGIQKIYTVTYDYDTVFPGDVLKNHASVKWGLRGNIQPYSFDVDTRNLSAENITADLERNNALNRMVMQDSTNGKFYYKDVSSIASGGGSGTVTSITAGVGLAASPSPIINTGTLSADTSGVLATKTWVSTRGYTTTALPTGTQHYTLRHNGTGWESSSIIQNNGSRVGLIGAATTSQVTMYAPTNTEDAAIVLNILRPNLGNIARFTDQGRMAFGQGAGFYPTQGTTAATISRGELGIFVGNPESGANAHSNGAWVVLGRPTGVSHNPTSGASGADIVTIIDNFNPSSGAVDLRALRIRPTINQTGTASGLIVGLDYNPVLTSVLGTHYAALFRVGNVGIGTATPARSLDVGELRIRDLTTDTPTQIVGADADGDLGAITVGSGLSLSSGTLTATGAGTTNLSFTGSSSPVTLNSDTGTDVIFAAGSGLALSQSGGTATYSRTYSLIHTTITGGSTFFGTTAERPDNDTPGSATTSAVGSDFSVSGSTIDYTGAGGALLRVEGSISFSVADDGDYYLSLYKEGTDLVATSMRISCVAGNYYSISLPTTTTSGSTNDTFDLRIATVTGNSTTTMHRYGFILERIY